MNSIPSVDLAGRRSSGQILEACREIGFVSILGHGIATDRFTKMRTIVRALFDLDEPVKRATMISPDNYRGFIPLGFFTPNRAEANGIAADQYEGYKIHWECPPDHPVRGECELYGPNRWPPELPELAQTVSSYWAACDRVADQLLDIFAPALGIEPDAFRSWHQTPLSSMTLLHYPPAAARSEQTAGIHPHKDTNVLTLLHPDPVGGLEVRTRDNRWVQPAAPPGALLVNVGEMLELWSGGQFVATPHRVTNNTGQHRYSFPYFLTPNHDVVVEPLLPLVGGFQHSRMPVGELSAEVWRTNWPDQDPSPAGFDLGTLDR